MTRFKPIAIAALLLFALFPLSAQTYAFRSIEVEDGLSQNMVYCVLQDSDGFIWIGTQNGLNRYDGSSFRIFKTEPGGLTNDGICSLAEDSSGNIWVGTLFGLQIYNPVGESFRPVPIRDVSGHPVEGLVRDIEFDANGSAFVAIADTCLVRIDQNLAVEQISLGDLGPGIRMRDLHMDGEGNLWIASYVGGLYELPAGSDRLRSFPFGSRADRMFTKVAAKDNETLLVGTMDHGVLEFNLRTKSYSNAKGLERKSVRFVHDIMVDSQGSIWVGAENGLHISTPEGLTRLTHSVNSSDSISDNAVFCICEDDDGGVWVGTYFGGVNYYSKYSSQFRKFYPIPGVNALKGKNISEFLDAPDGSIWIGTEDAGLHRFNPADGSFSSGYLPAGNIHALAFIDGALWAGSYSDGLFIMDADGGNPRRVRLSGDKGTPGDDSIYSILQDVSGKIWLGTESGLFAGSSSRGPFVRTAEEFISRQVNDILQDFEGNIWFATMGQGLLRFDPSTGIWHNLALPDTYITCILEDSQHDLWLGTENSGLCWYNHRTKAFERQWTESDGLPNNMIYKVLEDNSGGIWGSTNHGLFHLAPYRDRVFCFDHSSGLVCDQFNYKSGLKARDGTFYFGGVKGFTSFVPTGFNLPARKSRIVFNRFLLFNREVLPGQKGSPLSKSIIYQDDITLNASQGMFSVGFADLDYSSSGIKTYQYRLVGHDRQWIDIENTHLLSFSNLAPGRYRLEVRANPLNSYPGDDVKSLDIHIMPPWYRSSVAFAVMTLAVLALLFFAVSAVVRRAKQRSREEVLREISEASKADLQFRDHLDKTIEENLSNPDFGIDALCEELHMSRSTLYRKMKGITNLSGSDYIKQYRLNQAAELISKDGLQISEVAGMVGFNSVSYFSRCFRAHYGVSPKAYSATSQSGRK